MENYKAWKILNGESEENTLKDIELTVNINLWVEKNVEALSAETPKQLKWNISQEIMLEKSTSQEKQLAFGAIVRSITVLVVVKD